MDAHDFTVTSVLACRCAFSLRNDLSSLIFEIETHTHRHTSIYAYTYTQRGIAKVGFIVCVRVCVFEQREWV